MKPLSQIYISVQIQLQFWFIFILRLRLNLHFDLQNKHQYFPYQIEQTATSISQKQNIMQQQSYQQQSEDKTIFSFIQQDKPYKCYHIINKRTNQTFTQGPQVSCRQLSNTNLKQLWIFQKQKNKDKDQYSTIISFGTGLVLTRNNNGQSLACQKFKTKDNQLWKIQFAFEDQKTKQKYFWIESKADEEQCIFAAVKETNLRLLKYDRTLFTSLWKIEEVDQNDKNFGFCQIRSFASNLLLQAPDAAIRQQGPLIQTKQQGKGTQKWIIEKLFSSYVIRNLCSGLVMSVGQQIKENFQILTLLTGQVKNCRKITQEVFQNSNNQKWNLIKMNQNQFYFQSAQSPDKFLGSLNLKERTPIYLVGNQHFGEQMKNILWKVRGALPQAVIKQKILDIFPSTSKDQSERKTF